MDLVKAFDSVPLELLWRVMLRKGVPPKIVTLLKALHATVKVKFEIDGVERTLMQIIGVKQGDVLGPDLFIFLIAAIMESWRATHDYDLTTFRTARDFEMTGRRPTAHGEEVAVPSSEYADDTAMPFCGRGDVEEQVPAVCAHFGDWGMEVHSGTYDNAGNVVKKSKSEILFCPAPARCYYGPHGAHGHTAAAPLDAVDMSDVKLPGGRFMQVVTKFPYLGSWVAANCGDAEDVDSRVSAASTGHSARCGSPSSRRNRRIAPRSRSCTSASSSPSCCGMGGDSE